MKVQKFEVKTIGPNPKRLEPINKAKTILLARALDDVAHVPTGHPKYQSARHSRVRIQGNQLLLRMSCILVWLRELSRPFQGRKLLDRSGHKGHVRANPNRQFQ